MKLTDKIAHAYANLVTSRPGTLLVTLLLIALGSGWASSRLTINSNQLDLISQELPEVKEVKRVVDMVGGAGFLIIGLRSDDEKQLKAVSDDLAAMLEADKENVRTLTYKVPVEFMRKNMTLFIKTEDLAEGKKRIDAYLADQLERQNPFRIEFETKEPVKLDLTDLTDKYSKVGKKSIVDDYYISNDRKMITLLVKPMWDTNQIDKTEAFLEKLNAKFAEYSKQNPRGVTLVEDYSKMGDAKTIAYGYTGSYKTTVDDSAAMINSLRPVSLASFCGILLLMAAFFRKALPVFLICAGMAMGAVITMGFAWVTIGELNMVTSIIGGILMGLGEDFGTHLAYRIRQELGGGKKGVEAIREAVIHSGVPGFISALASSGAFFALMFSEFRAFSQFGFLAGFGIFIIGITLFVLKPAVLTIVARKWPNAFERLVGVSRAVADEKAVPVKPISHAGLRVAVLSVIVLALCAAALPWSPVDVPRGRASTLLERIRSGVRFDYNTRALMPERMDSVALQDEIKERFDISSDPLAIYTKDVADAKLVYDHLTKNKDKYPSVEQVVSLYSFVPPPDVAAANAKILEQWQEEMKDVDVNALPPDLQEKAKQFFDLLAVRPYDVTGVPDVYQTQFKHLATTKPENHGILTFLYPRGDLWDGKNMMKFAAETHTIETESGKTFYGAGLPMLYAKLANIVLFDGKLSVALTALWILIVLLVDFRSVKMALTALLPLALGVGAMLGVMALFDIRLNFMNIVVLPVVLGYGVSHGVYLLHVVNEGASPAAALKSVGTAVAASTLTTIAGFAALMFASHKGLVSMGIVACLGLTTSLVVTFTLLPAVLQVIDNQKKKSGGASQSSPPSGKDESARSAA